MASKAKTSKVVETTEEDTSVQVILNCVYGDLKPETLIKLEKDEAESLIKIGFAVRA